MKKEMDDMETVRKNPMCFRELPAERKTESVCWTAVNADTTNIRYVPEETLTYEIIGNALSINPGILREIPHKPLLELLPYILADDKDLFAVLPKDVLTTDIYEAIVKEDGYNLQYVPDGMKTPEICMVAEKRHPDLFQKRPEILPDHVKTGCNVYTLNKMLENATGEKYGAEQIKKFYDGGTLQTKNFITPHGVLKNQEVRFDKEKKEFFFNPLKQERKKGLRM